MWLMTKHGFYSIVQKETGVFHVRSRERADIENLIRGVPLPAAQVQESQETDYAARVVVGPGDLTAIMQFLALTLDYPNFKSRIDATPGQSHKPYHQVWRVLAEALGAYGRPGRAARKAP